MRVLLAITIYCALAFSSGAYAAVANCLRPDQERRLTGAVDDRTPFFGRNALTASTIRSAFPMLMPLMKNAS
jgi:hypothetical protein